MNRDVAMNVVVKVKTINGFEILSGNRYPILSNRSVEHDIRLKEGESSVIGGIITDSDSVGTNGIPGVEKIPLLKYLFATETKERQEGELIIVITPHIVRLPDFADSDLESLAIMGSGISPRFIGKPVQLGSGKAAGTKPGPPLLDYLPPYSPQRLRHQRCPRRQQVNLSKTCLSRGWPSSNWQPLRPKSIQAASSQSPFRLKTLRMPAPPPLR